MTITLSQQPMQHGAERRNPRSRGNKHGVARRRMQNEIAERPLKRNLGAGLETAKMVRHESIVHAIQTESDVSVFRRRRRDRIGARDLLALGSRGLHRKPLSRDKVEMSNSVYFEFNVLGKLGERERAKHSRVEGFKLSHRVIR